VAALSAILALAAGMTAAQDNQQPVEIVSKIVAAEVWTCSYNDGQGPEDLDAAVEAWTAWADEGDVDDYAAWTLTRHYYSAEQDFDFIWLGAWSDGNAMGRGTDMLYSTGGEILGNFFRVASCNNHINAGSIAYKLPEGDAPDNAVLTFSNCTIEDDANYAQIVDATKAWADALKDAGSQSAIYHWFPIYGGGNADIDFVWLSAYPNHTELGADYQRMTNGEMFRQRNALFASLMDCDVTRVYNAQTRRAARIR
jgi:hypothetical protein